jgi:hypothetical protein
VQNHHCCRPKCSSSQAQGTKLHTIACSGACSMLLTSHTQRMKTPQVQYITAALPSMQLMMIVAFSIWPAAATHLGSELPGLPGSSSCGGISGRYCCITLNSTCSTTPATARLHSMHGRQYRTL